MGGGGGGGGRSSQPIRDLGVVNDLLDWSRSGTAGERENSLIPFAGEIIRNTLPVTDCRGIEGSIGAFVRVLA